MKNLKLIRPFGLMLVTLLFFNQNLFSQELGYELRTNTKSYLYFGYSGFELRHRTDLKENRITYRYNINLDKKKKLTFSVPLHYKVEKQSPTLEPRIIYSFPKFKLWAQQEFWIDQKYNLAIAADIKVNKITYRIGWDNSNTFRFRMKYSLK